MILERFYWAFSPEMVSPSTQQTQHEDFGGVIQKTVFIDLPKDSEDLFEAGLDPVPFWVSCFTPNGFV